MRYRILQKPVVHEIVGHLAAGEHIAIETRAVERGDGEGVDYLALDDILLPFRDELERSSRVENEIFEGRLAAATHPWFSAIPVEVLDDPGFWRYLAVKHFWWFTAWREADPIAGGKSEKYVDATLPAEQIPLRLYLRAKSIDKDGDVSLAGEIPSSTDFWRSHIVRVRVSSARPLARAFATKKRDGRGARELSTDKVRKVARRVNRAWTNILLDLYDEDEAHRMIEEIMDQTLNGDVENESAGSDPSD